MMKSMTESIAEIGDLYVENNNDTTHIGLIIKIYKSPHRSGNIYVVKELNNPNENDVEWHISENFIKQDIAKGTIVIKKQHGRIKD